MRFPTTPSVASGVGVWRHFTLTMAAGPSSTVTTDYKLTVDGTVHAAQNSDYGLYSGNASRIGWDGADNGAGAVMDDVRFYNRVITPNEIQLLAQRPGIAYERAPRKFYSLPAAASSRQYRLFRPSILRGA